jgi:CRP-like cAMP-binding protein
MSARLSSVFPRPAASDPDDVVWTLQTAAVQWQRGLRADAIVWVRKAADISTQLGRTPRAEELRNNAARLAEYLWSDPEEPPEGLVPRAGAAVDAVRRVHRDDEDEIIEVEEVDGYELEFSETDLATPEDAVADISPEDLSYYTDAERSATAPLPDDLDLSSEPPPAAAPTSESFLSIGPESERAGDSFISVSPEPDEADGYVEVVPESIPVRAASSPLPMSPSDYPTYPRIERPPAFVRDRERDVARATPAPPLATPLAPLPPSTAFDSLAPVTAVSPTSFGSASNEAYPSTPAARVEFFSEAPATAVAPLVSPSASAALGDGPPSVDGLAFESVEALADLPEEAQAELAASGQMLTLEQGEELLLTEGVALLTRGHVHVTLPFSDVSAGRVGPGAVVAARGSIEAGPLRLIADAERAHLVRWSDAQLAQSMRDCTWVVDDLRQLADRLQAHASAGLGPLGERLDDALRAAVYERLQVRVLAPDELVAERGKPLKGLFVVAVGELSVSAGSTERSIRSGQFVFPGSVIGAEPAPADVRAGPKGGLVLFATRPVAHELMMSVPPLLEILAS